MKIQSKPSASPMQSTEVAPAAGPAICTFETPVLKVPQTSPRAVEARVWQNRRADREGDEVSDNYRISHCALGYGEHYNKTHESGYYGALWTKIEKPLLVDVLGPMGGAGRKCLDFACGTGRITNIAAELFDEVVGVDVSGAMLACARVPDNVKLRHIDMTVDPLGETFDVVTAFRFFLNAEDSLRREALTAIHDQLNDQGRLVANVHMNATSPVGVACRMLNQVFGRTLRNTLSASRFNELLVSSGFTVEHLIPYGYLPRPGHFLPGLCQALIEPVEKASKTLKLPGSLAQHFLVVANKR
ncbi:class I SAM-dependent methyltransferase [Mesorhizobium sp. ESP7-2]|uniref:class I SAM-dependent methyltransferase n=1 Tax=unclassified Mesorhizobium TaxID=325217 RepID=UPI001CD039F2|nr:MULTISPECIES: class I SAM-dependent methyltransferase [unclassified Mesorhizobium]MBZ9673811.1 class I SAM-dependent methyltransferase [Mesorhizobium sp. ES1-3]MBZ9711096.1 class I SAM-dependent methyltransferase [Mesorhizobium sp. ESP7-2]